VAAEFVTMTSKPHDADWFDESVAVHVTCVVPTLKAEPDAGLQVTDSGAVVETEGTTKLTATACPVDDCALDDAGHATGGGDDCAETPTDVMTRKIPATPMAEDRFLRTISPHAPRRIAGAPRY
jgi:hypothetical protein